MKFRDLANAALHKSTLLGLAGRLVIQRVFKLTHEYQPDPFRQNSKSDLRACHDRYKAIEAALGDIDRPSVIDVGCNQGYFTFRFTEKKGFCTGIDNDRSELMAARSMAAAHKVGNVSFLEQTLDKDSIKGLPVSDVVICLSIFHHWVRHYGEQEACTMLQVLSEKAGKALVFDTGQPEENDATWADALSFMQPSGSQWIENKLKELGFEEVYHLQGGILKYLEVIPEEESLWQGDCFVFDDRVSVRHGLEVGDYDWCPVCDRPAKKGTVCCTDQLSGLQRQWPPSHKAEDPED